MTHKILIIEDRQDTANILNDALKHERYAVTAERSGKKGLDAVGRFKPDLIILDLMLPDMDGMDILKKIREDHGSDEVKIIILTASSIEGKERKEYSYAGADLFLEKPIHVEELREDIRKLLEK